MATYTDLLDALSSGEDIGGILQEDQSSYTAARPAYEEPKKIAAILRPTEGAARVNANTANTGVTASVDSKGQLSLTNLGENGVPQYPKALGGQGPGTGAVASNTPLSVNSLFNQLKAAGDIDTARGIGASLREAVAVEKTKYEMQAQTFAQNKLGLPRLESELQAAIAADQADIKYKPGMGDSPITARIRTNIEQARQMADNEAKRFLSSNAQYATLGATAANADSEIQRITRIGDRKTALQDQLELGKINKAAIKEEQLTETARGLSGMQRQRLLMLNPELARTDPDKLDADMIRTIQANVKNKAWADTFEAPEEKLPALAVAGNEFATALVVSKEEANTGIDPVITKAKLEGLRAAVVNPAFLKVALEEKYRGQDKAKKLIGDELASLNEKQTTPEGKAAVTAYKMDLALQLARKKVSMDFEQNASSWKIDDPEFKAATVQARQVTGKTAMLDVLNAYVGDATGANAVLKTKLFADLMTTEAEKQSKSIFGAPNYLDLRAKIIKTAVSRGPIAAWLVAMDKKTQQESITTNIPLVRGLSTAGGMAFDRLFGSKPLIDPTTGEIL